MKVKEFLVVLLTFAMISCGGGSDNDSDDSTDTGTNSEEQQVTACTIIDDVLSLDSGQSCTLSDTDAQKYSISAGEIECDNGTINMGGGSYSSGTNGFSMNGLSIKCALETQQFSPNE